MALERLVVLAKIKELLKLNPKSKSIGADTLVLVFKVSLVDLMIKLMVLEQEGYIRLYSVTKKTSTRQVIMIALVSDNETQPPQNSDGK